MTLTRQQSAKGARVGADKRNDCLGNEEFPPVFDCFAVKDILPSKFSFIEQITNRTDDQREMVSSLVVFHICITIGFV